MNELPGPGPPAHQSPADVDGRPRYTRSNPYHLTVLVNRLLSGEGSEKETRHLALSLEPGMTYLPGDAVGVVPEHRAEAVSEVLAALGSTGQERVLDHDKEEISFELALRSWLAIGKLARGTVGQYAKLPAAVARADADTTRCSCYAGRKTSRAPRSTAGAASSSTSSRTFPARSPHRRSSSMCCHGCRRGSTPSPPARLCIPIPWRRRCALCATTHIAAAGREWPAASWVSARMWARSCPSSCITNQNFRLPEDGSTPVIMVGPGTGVAPFRAFLQECRAKGDTGKNWLIFGDQRRASDFLYQDLWTGMQADGTLTRLDTAFSRDQSNKVYVQDRIRENAAQMYAWLERGAILLCLRRCRPHGQGRGAGAARCHRKRAERHARPRGRISCRHEAAEALPARHLLGAVLGYGGRAGLRNVAVPGENHIAQGPRDNRCVEAALDAEGVRPPVDDGLLDLFPRQLLLQRARRQRRHFGVGGEAQPDQLVFRQRLAGGQLLRAEQRLQAAAALPAG